MANSLITISKGELRIGGPRNRHVLMRISNGEFTHNHFEGRIANCELGDPGTVKPLVNFPESHTTRGETKPSPRTASFGCFSDPGENCQKLGSLLKKPLPVSLIANPGLLEKFKPVLCLSTFLLHDSDLVNEIVP